jgi:beta-glucosidase
METITFPQRFAWGAATSAYQIEGAPNAEGKGPSIWDEFSRRPGKVTDGTTGDVACDHFHRYREDVEIMSRLGLGAYRFSVAWSRVLPRGTGRVNAKGLDFYDRLVDELCAKDIDPFVTLYHWDLPAALEKRGGWVNRDSAEWFADYSAIVVNRLRDRVRFWTTLNEPLATTAMGYLYGQHAPGKKGRLIQFLKASHNLLRAHGLASQRMRSADPNAQIGIANVTSAIHPAGPGCERAVDIGHQFVNELYLKPVMTGHYPPFIARLMRLLNLQFRRDDMKDIQQPLDYIGVNNYTRRVVKPSRNPLLPISFITPEVPERDRTGMGWEISPRGIYEVLKWLQRDYSGTPIYVTENGGEFADQRITDGSVADPKRIAFLSRYLAEVHRAIGEGADVRGYFVWSLLDNFEWNHGLAKRFGIVHVDYETLERTIKASGHWYEQVCRQNGFSEVVTGARPAAASATHPSGDMPRTSPGIPL